jgi:hypothetical protein
MKIDVSSYNEDGSSTFSETLVPLEQVSYYHNPEA